MCEWQTMNWRDVYWNWYVSGNPVLALLAEVRHLYTDYHSLFLLKRGVQVTGHNGIHGGFRLFFGSFPCP